MEKIKLENDDFFLQIMADNPEIDIPYNFFEKEILDKKNEFIKEFYSFQRGPEVKASQRFIDLCNKESKRKTILQKIKDFFNNLF